ncbi:hypothetical protein ABVK25_005676 [Lepraria finkii]|uniref:Uncharacterized protein n=1 Tax=Lepraria finkii TaxID=1340010 RepID=A0ABR4B9S8_9LECA
MKCFSLLFRLSGIGIAKSNGYETVAQLFWSGQRLHLELVHSPQRHSIGVLRLGLDSWPLNEGFERKPPPALPQPRPRIQTPHTPGSFFLSSSLAGPPTSQSSPANLTATAEGPARTWATEVSKRVSASLAQRVLSTVYSCMRMRYLMRWRRDECIDL